MLLIWVQSWSLDRHMKLQKTILAWQKMEFSSHIRTHSGPLVCRNSRCRLSSCYSELWFSALNNYMSWTYAKLSACFQSTLFAKLSPNSADVTTCVNSRLLIIWFVCVCAGCVRASCTHSRPCLFLTSVLHYVHLFHQWTFDIFQASLVWNFAFMLIEWVINMYVFTVSAGRSFVPLPWFGMIIAGLNLFCATLNIVRGMAFIQHGHLDVSLMCIYFTVITNNSVNNQLW